MPDDLRLPFRRNTRQRIRQTSTAQSLAGGGSALSATANFQLDRVGLLNYLIMYVRGTVTLAGAGAFANLGPWSIVDRVRVDLNLGNMNIVDISGWQLYQINKMLFRGWSLDGAAGLFTPSATTFSAPLAMGANSWIIPFIIPISANPGSQFDTGLVSLQAPEVQVNVQVRMASAGANFVTMFTSLTAVTVELHPVYYEYPNPAAVMLPPGQVVRTVEVSQPINATGDTVYTIDRQGTLLQLCSSVLLNNARTNAIDRLRLVANINDTIYDLLPGVCQLKNQMDQSSGADTGIFNIDLWHAGENPSSYDDRDVVDTEVLTTLQEIVTVSGGLGAAGTNFFNTARRVLVNFAPATYGPAL